MKGFFRYIPPFAPDYSGAVSALYGAGGMVVLCDPGGCSGNVAGYDEPRFYGTKPEFFSAAIREMDTIFGRDDRLERKIISAAALNRDLAFIALVGTPVVSVIGTDLKAIAKKVENATGIPAFAVETNGMDDYSLGEEKAITAYLRRFSDALSAGQIIADHPGLLGATPLNAAGGDDLAAACNTAGEPYKCCSAASCIAVGRFFQTALDYPETPELLRAADEIASRIAAHQAKRVLIVHQFAAADRLRRILTERLCPAGGAQDLAPIRIDTGSFFAADHRLLRMNGLAGEENLAFSGEDELVRASSDYDLVAADSLYFRAVRSAQTVPFPHRALSAQLFL